MGRRHEEIRTLASITADLERLRSRVEELAALDRELYGPLLLRVESALEAIAVIDQALTLGKYPEEFEGETFEDELDE